MTNEDGSPQEMYNKGGESRCMILKRRFAVRWMIGRAFGWCMIHRLACLDLLTSRDKSRIQ